MSDFKAVSHYATLAGFRVMVMANRLACGNRIARLAHDNLISQLDMRIDEARRYIALENIYQTATDEWVVDNADAGMYDLQMRALDDQYNSIDLLAQSDILIDREEREWCFRGSNNWRSLQDKPPVQKVASEAELCGLTEIIEMIREETGLSFTTYALEADQIDMAITSSTWRC